MIFNNLLKYDKDTLLHKPHTKAQAIMYALSIIVIVAVVYFAYIQIRKDIVVTTEKEKVLVIREFTKFTREKLMIEINASHFDYPYIILAQAEHETGDFTSDIFVENHNLFGMKEAASRPTTAIGTVNGHALYKDWMNSVVDRAYYECKYLQGLSEAQYYQALKDLKYAQDTNYIPALQQRVMAGKLKKLFEDIKQKPINQLTQSSSDSISGK